MEEKTQRNEQIYKESTVCQGKGKGMTYEQLATKYKLSYGRIGAIIQFQKRKHERRDTNTTT